MELQKVTDLLTSIKSFLIARRKELNTKEKRSIHPRILTQERDGCILYTWNDFSTLTKTDSSVTHVGAYDVVTQTHKVLWIYNQKIKIVSCSINQERTLLAFTLVTKNDPSLEPQQEKYSAFLAELQATGERVFSLNLDRPNFLKVQFLYSNKGETNTTRDAHMLVFLHKESIGLYHIPLARLGDKGIIMNDQPRTEHVVKRFVWCQWDVQLQRLHYIHNTRHSTDVNKIYPKYSCLQFYADARFDNMLDVPLSFPFPYIRSASRCRYVDIPLNPGIPDIDLNIQVLSQSNGTVCICYQHLLQAKKSEKQTEEKDDVFDINYYVCMVHHAKTLHGCVNGLRKSVIKSKRVHFQWCGGYLGVLLPGVFLHLLNVTIDYEPCHHMLLHSGLNEIELVTSTSSSSHPADNSRSNETSLDHNTRSLQEDVSDRRVLSSDNASSLETSPILSMATALPEDDNESPITSANLPIIMSVMSENSLTIRSLTSCFGFTRESSGSNIVYDQRSGIVWKISLNPETLLQYFQSASWPTRLAILHYVLTRTKDFFYVKKIFKDICESVTNTEAKKIMAEYLVASTYMNMKRQLEKDLLRLLPFTSVEPYKGQFEKNDKRERIASIKYTGVDSINITTKTARERQYRHSEDLWDALRRCLRLKQVEPKGRFNHNMIDSEKQPRKYQKSNKREQSYFLGNVKDRRSGQSFTLSTSATGHQSVTDAILGSTPAFLQGAHGEDNSYNTNITLQMEVGLTEHIGQNLKKDNRAKAKNVAQEYVACQFQQSKQLCHLLWSLIEPNLELIGDQFIPKLCDSGGADEYELFMLYERFYMTVKECVFPFPPGFQTFFTALAFRCLNFHLFVQYVDRGVLQLTGDFMQQILVDLSDKGEEFEYKYQLISKLPKECLEECFKQWNHPIATSYIAKQQTTQILTLGKEIEKMKLEKKIERERAGTTDSSSSSNIGEDIVTFSPLNSFINYLLETSSALRIMKKKSNIDIPKIDPIFLQEVALYHVAAESNYDLSLVNF